MPLIPSHLRSAERLKNVEQLGNEHREEVLKFLSRRPIHTVCMTSYIRDHGIESPLNRGRFYSYRNSAGLLEGVALIGHATLVETHSKAALKAFARLKYQYSDSHLIRGERDLMRRFRRYYERLDNTPTYTCRESLFEQTEAPESSKNLAELRLATVADLNSIIRINAQMIISECGIDPMVRDPLGFRSRVTRRIEQGRIWVWTRDDRLVFKADVFAETPEMSYLEGINVHPLYRGLGYGTRCMNSLSRILLKRSQALCLLVNEESKDLCKFYERAGFAVRGTYDTIYLDAQNH